MNEKWEVIDIADVGLKLVKSFFTEDKQKYNNLYTCYSSYGAFQVALAQMEYQLPRLTKMWSHLERQAGGKVKGMGEKQIEVDKRILRTQVSNNFFFPVFYR